MDGHKELHKAKILFAAGQLEESIILFTAAEKNGSSRKEVCLSRGAAHMALGRHTEAVEDFNRVLAEDKENERAYYYRGLACFALGDYQNAIEDLTLSLMRNNNRGIAHLIRGVAYAELGEENLAALDMNSATAFSRSEFQSFRKLFGGCLSPFQNMRALTAEENAPWRNLLSEETAKKLLLLMDQ